jgi:AbrB family looped-hinge helix DNA binding protein
MSDRVVKQSKITAKYQVTIPREVRDRLKLKVADAIVWNERDGNIYITAAEFPFAKYKGVIKVGRGDIGKDIEKARDAMADRLR